MQTGISVKGDERHSSILCNFAKDFEICNRVSFYRHTKNDHSEQIHDRSYFYLILSKSMKF